VFLRSTPPSTGESKLPSRASFQEPLLNGQRAVGEASSESRKAEDCPNLSAAARLMPPRNAGTSTMATSTPARSRSARAILTMRIRGNGTAGSHPGDCTNGTAATFDQARADFESAWLVFLSKRTEADFQAWRDQRDWTARKYALWDAGKRLPPNEWEPGKPCSIYLKCPCGNIFNSHRLEENLVHVPHITAEHKAREVRRAQTVQ
jgi:hypothetical protein